MHRRVLAALAVALPFSAAFAPAPAPSRIPAPSHSRLAISTAPLGVRSRSVRPALRMVAAAPTSLPTADALKTSQLAQLASMTVLSIDTGDLDIVEKFAATGYITDATTNPLFVSQAGLSGDPRYVAFVDEAITYAKEKMCNSDGCDVDDAIALAMDRLAVNLGKSILSLGVKGYVSTEVDPRLSFDKEQSLERARRIIQMYADEGISRDRVLIKLAATWEGICAAEELEKEGITCNLTLVFGTLQAKACAQRGVRLISPFPGRILDWHKADKGFDACPPNEDPGVVACAEMYGYFKKYGHETICMPASWRPSRGKGYELDEIRELSGTDRMTIPPNLLTDLANCQDPLPRKLEAAAAAAACTAPPLGGGRVEEKEFRFLLNQDGCTTEKMAQGIRAFVADTEKLEEAIRNKFME